MRYSYVDKHLKEYIDNGVITSSTPIATTQIQPSSLDLRIWSVAYEIDCPFVPVGINIDDYIKERKFKKVTITSDFILKKWKHYLLECQESIRLPSNVFAIMSSKISIGRIDLHVRVITDYNTHYDHIAYWHSWKLWFIVTSNSFNLSISSGVPISQMMLFEERDKIISDNFRALFDKNQAPHTVLHFSNTRNKIDVTIDLTPWEIAWYKALITDDVLILKEWENNSSTFFEPIYPENNSSLKVEKHAFYILTTYERIVIPSNYSCEMNANDNTKWELRVHYAWFFWPWSWTYNNGNLWVLEIRPYEDMHIFHRQPIAQMIYNPNIDNPEQLYWQKRNSYSNQRKNTLSKYFKI